MRYNFDAINIGKFTEQELSASNNPFARVIFIAKLALLRGKDREIKWFEGKLTLLRKLFELGRLEDRKSQNILVFMERYLLFEDRDLRMKFREQVDKLTNKKNAMDFLELAAQVQLADARDEGEKLGRESVARELLTHSKFSDERIAAITKIPKRHVARIRKQIRSRKLA